MIPLIAAALNLFVMILGEIFTELSLAKAQQQAVDTSNQNFQAIVNRVLARISQGNSTAPQDNAADDELNKLK